jgi:hypothetical protein
MKILITVIYKNHQNWKEDKKWRKKIVRGLAREYRSTTRKSTETKTNATTMGNDVLIVQGNNVLIVREIRKPFDKFIFSFPFSNFINQNFISFWTVLSVLAIFAKLVRSNFWPRFDFSIWLLPLLWLWYYNNNNQAFYSQVNWSRLEMKSHETDKNMNKTRAKKKGKNNMR